MMKKVSTRMKSRITRTAAVALCGVAAALAASGLMANAAEEQPTRRGDCQDWPPDADKALVAQGFDQALKDSAGSTQAEMDRRGRLLDPKLAQKEMEYIFEHLPHGRAIKFPPKSIVRFYEPEINKALPPAKSYDKSSYPADHCYHILFLPEVGPNPKASFKDNLMCCYIPW
jgi:hypothetical protein